METTRKKKEYVVETRLGRTYRKEKGFKKLKGAKSLERGAALHRRKRSQEVSRNVPIEIKSAIYECGLFSKRFMSNVFYIVEKEKGMKMYEFCRKFNKEHENRMTLTERTMYKLRTGERITMSLYFYFLVAEAIGKDFMMLATMDIPAVEYQKEELTKQEAISKTYKSEYW